MSITNGSLDAKRWQRPGPVVAVACHDLTDLLDLADRMALEGRDVEVLATPTKKPEPTPRPPTRPPFSKTIITKKVGANS
jgi:hypothetical protein